MNENQQSQQGYSPLENNPSFSTIDPTTGNDVVIKFTGLVQDVNGNIFAIGTHGCTGPPEVTGLPSKYD